MLPKWTIHPGMEDEELINEIARGSKFQQARILNVVRPDLAKQLRDVLNLNTSPGGLMDTDKVDESEIVPAATKTIPFELDPYKYMAKPKSEIVPAATKTIPFELDPYKYMAKPKSEILEVIKTVVKPKAKKKAKRGVKNVTKPVATSVRTIQVAKPVVKSVVKPVDIPVVTPVAKSAILTEETDLSEPISTIHPGLEDSDIQKIIDEGGARAERVLRVITTGKADVPVKTFNTTSLLLIGAVILIIFYMK